MVPTGAGERVVRPSLTVTGEIAGGRRLRAKRALDVMLAAGGLLASAPLWVVIAAAIKVDDHGPVFHAQERLGIGGRLFRLLKFRSMIPDAERATGAVLAAPRDPRITRIGHILRATALDELPQLLSILRGDMSFVGPRPERPDLVRRFAVEVPGYHRRFAVKPGLTGLAQVYGRYDSSPRDKLRYDLLYARRAGLGLDLRLIALSVWITLRGKWEHRGRKF